MKQCLRKKEYLMILVAALYILFLSVIDLTCDFTSFSFYSDIVSFVSIIIPLVFLFIFKKKDKQGVFVFISTIIFAFISIPASFIYSGLFQSHRLMFFIPSLLLIMLCFKGVKRIISIAVSVIIYMVAITYVILLPELTDIYADVSGLTPQLWSLVATVLCVLSFVYIHNIKEVSTDDKKVAEMDFSDSDTLVCIYIEDADSLKRQIGVIEFNDLYNKVHDYITNFEDSDSKTMAYGGERFMLFFRNKDESFLSDLAEGIVLSVNDELKILEPLYLKWKIYKRDPEEDIQLSIRNADKI